MRLAFVDNVSVGGGISRYSLLLCRSLLESFPALHIDYFIHNDNLARIPELKSLGRVKICTLTSTLTPSYVKRKMMQISSATGLGKKSDKVMEEIEALVDAKYDLAFFPSAHMMAMPKLSIPIVGTIHDFNWKYFFGGEIFTKSFVEVMSAEIPKWLNKGLTISSSKDVLNEAQKFYPGSKNYPAVVPIGPIVVNASISDVKADEILNSLGIDFPYIIFPGNFFPHKNHLNLFTAFHLLKKRKGFERYKLILTGTNSDRVERAVAEYRGVRLVDKKDTSAMYDVIGLGYQPNEVMDTLIFKAKILVSPSIYEAICTPAMDAWNFATPTAISDIPPFREHEQTWGIKTAFFDPMSPVNIADVLEAYLNNYEKAKQDAIISQSKMLAYTWTEVANSYMNVFNQAIEQH